jgi:hypothetical protein
MDLLGLEKPYWIVGEGFLKSIGTPPRRIRRILPRKGAVVNKSIKGTLWLDMIINFNRALLNGKFIIFIEPPYKVVADTMLETTKDSTYFTGDYQVGYDLTTKSHFRPGALQFVGHSSIVQAMKTINLETVSIGAYHIFRHGQGTFFSYYLDENSKRDGISVDSSVGYWIHGKEIDSKEYFNNLATGADLKAETSKYLHADLYSILAGYLDPYITYLQDLMAANIPEFNRANHDELIRSCWEAINIISKGTMRPSV